MKYFIDNQPATDEAVKAQTAENNRILNIGDPDEFLKEASKIKFIFSENVITELNRRQAK